MDEILDPALSESFAEAALRLGVYVGPRQYRLALAEDLPLGVAVRPVRRSSFDPRRSPAYCRQCLGRLVFDREAGSFIAHAHVAP